LFDTLRCQTDQVVMLTSEERFVACHPINSDLFVCSISPHVANCLGLKEGDSIAIHRPLSKSALDEAAEICQLGVEHTYQSAEVTEFSESEVLDELLNCLRSERPVSFSTDARYRKVSGGCIEFGSIDSFDWNMPTPIAIAKPTPVAPPTLETLVDFLHAEQRTTMELHLTKTDQEPPAEAGRVGGVPWLPKGTEWPRYQSKPMTFLAQLPLDSAIKAGVDFPFELPPGMMLSLFWEDFSGNPTSTGVLLHPAIGLERVSPPGEVTSNTLCSIELKQRKEVPSWERLESALRLHFGILPKELRHELSEYHEKQPQSREVSRLGGQGYWIQDDYDDFLFQLTSNDEADLCFYDSGCLYVCGSHANDLFVHVDSY
ncbi:MAG: DUF1963 domain-containing protein, partial [Planctomycetota bacterium]